MTVCHMIKAPLKSNLCLHREGRSKGGAVVRVLASHQCGPDSNPGVDAICGLSLLLVLSFAPRDFSLLLFCHEEKLVMGVVRQTANSSEFLTHIGIR